LLRSRGVALLRRSAVARLPCRRVALLRGVALLRSRGVALLRRIALLGSRGVALLGRIARLLLRPPE
jgi:hypothetical protein